MTRRQRLLRPLSSRWRQLRQQHNRRHRTERLSPFYGRPVPPWPPAPRPEHVYPSMWPRPWYQPPRAVYAALVGDYYTRADQLARDCLAAYGWTVA